MNNETTCKPCAVPLVVPPGDAFFPYVERAESAAKRAEEAASALPSPEISGRILIDAESQTGAITFTRMSGDTKTVQVSADSFANLSTVKRDTAYSAGDAAFMPSLPSWSFLICQTAGITQTAPPTVGNEVSEGDLISDGSCVWQVCRIKNAENLVALTSDQISGLFD